MKFIELTISASGETRVETKGFSGVECLAGSRFIEQALGSKTNEEVTAEYYQLTQQEGGVVAQSDCSH